MKTRSLSASIGTGLLDVDLRESLNTVERDQLRDLFTERHLLLFRNQTISHEDQERVVGYLGPVLPGPQWVSNVREDNMAPEGSLLFHSDFIFTAEPSLGIALYATDIPPDGSPTFFADTVRSAAQIPEKLRAHLIGRAALNIIDLTYKGGDLRYREATIGPETPLTPRYAHPILMRHPVTDQELLSVNEMQTDYIIGMDARESEETLAALCALLYAPENTYAHRWQVGDLVIWDNIALQHGRPAPPVNLPRTFRRLTMAKRDSMDLVPGFAEAYAARH